MQLLGACTMKAPRARAASSSKFMRGANSASRFTALLQWCRSHMSQTMIAVRPGSHDSAVVTTRDTSDAASVPTLVWSEKRNPGESALATSHGTPTANETVSKRVDTRLDAEEIMALLSPASARCKPICRRNEPPDPAERCAPGPNHFSSPTTPRLFHPSP